MKKVMVFLLLILAAPAYAGHLYPEKDYQAAWCSSHGGKTEVVLSDGTRADCVTDQYAIEFDFAEKEYESIGQALYYAAMLERYPGVVLIMESPDEQRYLDRLNLVARQRGIRVWTVTPGIFPVVMP